MSQKIKLWFGLRPENLLCLYFRDNYYTGQDTVTLGRNTKNSNRSNIQNGFHNAFQTYIRAFHTGEKLPIKYWRRQYTFSARNYERTKTIFQREKSSKWKHFFSRRVITKLWKSNYAEIPERSRKRFVLIFCTMFNIFSTVNESSEQSARSHLQKFSIENESKKINSKHKKAINDRFRKTSVRSQSIRNWNNIFRAVPVGDKNNNRKKGFSNRKTRLCGFPDRRK